jgi:hypothetical protein
MKRSKFELSAWDVYLQLRWIHDRYAHWNEAPIPKCIKAMKRFEEEWDASAEGRKKAGIKDSVVDYPVRRVP